ncbi:34198_t:CDS:2, partial [Gigaspora margarita]
NTSNLQLSTNKKKKKTKPFGEGRGKPAKLEAHLANECSKCPDEISRYWKEKLANKTSNYARQSKNPVLPTSISQTAITTHFMSDRPLPKSLIDRLDQKILKAWVMARVPFEVIENPFIQDMFKEFQPAYNLPSISTLSNQLLDEELARINRAIDNDLDNADHLTL